MNKLQTALLASTFLAVAAGALPANATGITGGIPPISDFGFSSTTTSYTAGEGASGYFTVSNNSTGWNVVGLGVGADPGSRFVFGDESTTRPDWFTSTLATEVFYDADTGSGSGNYLNPLTPGETESGFFWSESFGQLALDPPYFIDIFNPNTGDSEVLSGAFDNVATDTVPEPSTLSALIIGLLGLATFLGMTRRRPAFLRHNA